MANIDEYLQVSAQLFKLLANIPEGEEKSDYINTIHELLDKRGNLVDQLKSTNFQFDSSNKLHQMLFELDKGIVERLLLVMDEVKSDIKELQNSKKNEGQYIDPYRDIRTLEGRYFDNKK